jgi:hypothetical protein
LSRNDWLKHLISLLVGNQLKARLTDPGSTAIRDFSSPAPSMATNMIID